MNNPDFLLSDEKEISQHDYIVRERLYNAFESLPIDFLSKMRHFQPQVGCPNKCSFCSKFSSNKISYFDESTLRNVVSALKVNGQKYRTEKPYIIWERDEHRNGVVFPYLNNDIGNYFYLDKYIKLLFEELGVKTRISTVGFSRHNKDLMSMHKRIANTELVNYLGGVRLSLAPYGKVWEECNSDVYSLKEYQNDITNFISIYKPYFDRYGSGSRNMCIELRYKPLVEIKEVYTFNNNGYFVIITNNYMYVSKEKNIDFKVSHIKDALVHSIELTEEPILFNEVDLKCECKDIDQAYDVFTNYLNGKIFSKGTAEIYLFQNKEGVYYTVNPKLNEFGNYGINIYPKTDKRNTSGYIVTERFFINACYNIKKQHNLALRDKFDNATWDDVNAVIEECKKIAEKYLNNGKFEKTDYIINEIIPIVEIYALALKEAGYEASCFFDKNFTIDTGMICNLGRALHEFKGITKTINEPLTPTHERNYGSYCSAMKIENYAWRLSCHAENSILIEKLNLFNTASIEGQVSFQKIIDNVDYTKEYEYSDEGRSYLVPGEKEE